LHKNPSLTSHFQTETGAMPDGTDAEAGFEVIEEEMAGIERTRSQAMPISGWPRAKNKKTGQRPVF
jgi:hypothetical protein